VASKHNVVTHFGFLLKQFQQNSVYLSDFFFYGWKCFYEAFLRIFLWLTCFYDFLDIKNRELIYFCPFDLAYFIA